MSALTSIDEQWQGLSEMVFAKIVPGETQVAEMKKAFFAGAWAMFCGIEQLGTPEVSEERGEAWLEERRLECMLFKKKRITEYAEKN